MKNSDNDKFEINFSKMDASIKDLLSVIVKQELSVKKNSKESQKKRVKKKLNVDLIRQLLIETKELQQKRQENFKKSKIDNNDCKE